MSLGQVLLVPVQVSSTSQGPADARQTAPPLPAGCWQSSLEPSHVSVVHGLPSSVHAVPDGVFASAGHAGPVPGQFSAGSHSPADARQTVLAGSKASFGHVVLVPVQVSSTSHAPADPRQTEPALPAGCWQASLVPLQVSVVQTLPSSVQRVPLAFLASGGHGWPGKPPQLSAMSHSPAEGRQANTFGSTTSGGQVLLTPVHTSSGSHASPEPVRQTVPAFPAACWQASFVPSQRSVVQTFPSSVHAVPDGVFASAGQLGPVPVHISAGSHSPAEARQTTKLGSNMSVGHVLLVPSQVSSTSQGPADARQVAPALPAGS